MSKTKKCRVCEKTKCVTKFHRNGESRKATCKLYRKFGLTIDKQKFYIDKFKEVHGDFYDYSAVIYTLPRLKVKIICPVHGIFEQSPNSHLSGHGCRKCSIDKRRKEKTKNKIIMKKLSSLGRKDSQEKAPIYTFCKQFVNAIELLALRSKYGHEKYKEQDKDFMNFTRVENPDYEYGNAQFRHALGIGDDENELEHLTASAWNSIAKLETFLLENLDN